MKRIRLLSCLALAAATQLIFIPRGHAQAVAPPPPPPAQPYQLQQPMTPPPGAGPFVTLRSNNPRARLQQMRLTWQDVCVAPCGAPVDPSGTYRVGGGTIRASDPFRMPRASGPVLIDVRAGSTVKHWVGVGMAIGGGASALTGVLYLALASDQQADNFGSASRTANKAVGITYLVIGAILLAIGLPLSASSTKVQVQ